MSWSDPDDSTAENLQAWQRFSEAWAKRDIDGLMALMTDDIVYGASVGPEPGATFRGRDEVRRGFEHMLRHDQALGVHAGPVVIVGDHGFALPVVPGSVPPIARKAFQLPSGSFFNTISTVPRICFTSGTRRVDVRSRVGTPLDCPATLQKSQVLGFRERNSAPCDLS